MKILIADDDRFSRSSMRKMLESCDYKVLEAGDGEEALRIFIGEKPDIVVTDWMMPKIDGVELVRKIRAFDETRYCYVVMVTAKNESEDLVTGFAAGANDYVTKPFANQELLVRVRNHLRLSHALTERKQAELELRQAKNYLDNMFNAMPSVLVGIVQAYHFSRGQSGSHGCSQGHARGCQVLNPVAGFQGLSQLFRVHSHPFVFDKRQALGLFQDGFNLLPGQFQIAQSHTDIEIKYRIQPGQGWFFVSQGDGHPGRGRGLFPPVRDPAENTAGLIVRDLL